MSQFISQYFDVNFMLNHFDQVLKGFGTTMKLWAVSGVIALIWGLVLAVLRQLPVPSRAPASASRGERALGRLRRAPAQGVRFLSILYIDVFRGIPLLLVIFLIYGGFGALSSSNATPGPIPQAIAVPTWFGQPSAFWYGVMAIVITYGAYMAEVYRAGIESVPRGQTEAARSLGMSHGKAMRYVIVPQAIRTVIPPLLNDLIALMKDTSLVSVISLNEVVLVGTDLQSKTFNSSALTLGALMFLVVTLPLARVVDWLIARQQAKTQRGGAPTGGGPETAALQPLPSAGGGAGV